MTLTPPLPDLPLAAIAPRLAGRAFGGRSVAQAIADALTECCPADCGCRYCVQLGPYVADAAPPTDRERAADEEDLPAVGPDEDDGQGDDDGTETA
jgi:hypothetical protein